MAACSVFEPDDFKDQKYTNVEYSEDGKSLTIYIDGSKPVPVNRALSQRLAILGSDFFEVTFVYKSGAGNTANDYIIARGSWELGEPAGVAGVYRTAGGIDYYEETTTSVGMPATQGKGSAILFVGRKSDKSLLAVGTLSHIDNTSVLLTGAAHPLITSNTTKVTFAVNAFSAGVRSSSYATNSSFQTTYAQDASGTLKTIDIGGKKFPYYNLPVGSQNEKATYKFDVTSKVSPYTGFAFYAPAIIYAGGAKSWNVMPKYTLPPNIVKNESEYKYNDLVVISIDSPSTAGQSFLGTVDFNINTANADRVICALTFEVPVYALTLFKNSDSDPEPFTWHIRPGYGLYYQELDSGNYENGGAVLIGIGNIGGIQNSNFIYTGNPRKYNIHSSNYDDISRYFNIFGMEFYYVNGSIITALTPASDSTKYPYHKNYPDLKFYYGTATGAPANTPMPNSDTFTLPEGIIRIRVVYTRSVGETYELIYDVEVNNIDSSMADIPYENRFILTKDNDFTDAAARITGHQGSFLFVFTESINIPNMAFGGFTGPVSIFFISTVPNIIIGRVNGTRITFDGSTSNVTIYLGRWPFNEPTFAAGDVIKPETFRINSRGTYETIDGGGTLENTTMFGYGPNAGTLKINKLSSASVNYEGYLGPTIIP